MTVGTQTLGRSRRLVGLTAWMRRGSGISLALVMGMALALLILKLPMPAALASSVIGVFVLLALVDTRVALLALLLVRSTADVTTTIPLLSASGSSAVNANALMSLVIIVLGLSHIALNRVEVRRIPLVAPYAAFIAVTFVGIALAPDRGRAFEDWLRIVGTLMVFILCVDALASRTDQRWLVRVILLSSVVPLLVGLYQLAANTGDHGTPGFNRIYGTFVNPPPYAFYLVQLLPLAIAFLAHTRSRLARVGLAAMVPLMLVSIYATQTRGAWLGVIVMLLAFLWFRARRALLLVPLALGALYFGIPSVRARVSEATSGTCVSTTYCESSVFWRQKQWQEAIRVPSPVEIVTVGAGLSAVDVSLGNFTHNEYLRLLVETGLLGSAAIVALYWQLFRLARSGYRGARTPYERSLMLAFLIVFASRLVNAMSDNILVFPVLEWYFWSLAAVVVVTSGAYSRDRLTEAAVDTANGSGAGAPLNIAADGFAASRPSADVARRLGPRSIG